jgi:hypothetical protein
MAPPLQQNTAALQAQLMTYLEHNGPEIHISVGAIVHDDCSLYLTQSAWQAARAFLPTSTILTVLQGYLLVAGTVCQLCTELTQPDCQQKVPPIES